ncbi:MAG: hypothetical protein HUU41_04990 [Bryobacteraceae bacterium]|nr:hypothetical protein [Bryobacterales bacterium]NUN00448.1 hypothetical protein [Bryobacteraceae bacterium]
MRNTLLGFTAFPYDLTAEAVTKTHQIILPNSDLYAIHMDRCLPWTQALANAPFPQWLERDWDDIAAQIPGTHAVYVAVTPTSTDRCNKAAQCGDAAGEPKPLSRTIATARYDATAVKTAYVNYLRRVIQRFKPIYLNIGIEISEMALVAPALWPQYQALYLHTYSVLKNEFPALQIGIELVLQSLMHPAVAKLVKPAVEASDYIGISFYPYGSNFGVALGAPPLDTPPDQWRKPLEWLRTYTAKPIAVCETGYTTKNIHLAGTNLTATGSIAMQLQFTKDIIEFAKKHDYRFLIWFVPVDYERLLNKISAGEEKHVWVNAGFYDSDLKPKSAWAEWRKFHQVPKSAAAMKVMQSPPF